VKLCLNNPRVLVAVGGKVFPARRNCDKAAFYFIERIFFEYSIGFAFFTRIFCASSLEQKDHLL
jgi:hypothetical protein